MTTFREILDYLLDAGEAKTAYVPWGKGHRNVVIFKGKTYLYKLTGEVNTRLGKIILPLYISMSTNTQNKNQKSTYRVSIKEQLDKLKTNSIQNVKIDLTKINMKNIGNRFGTTK